MRARLARTHTRARCVHNKISHDTCHDPYNVPSKFGEDPLRNVEMLSRTDRHTDRQTHTHTHINSPIYSKIVRRTRDLSICSRMLYQ
jgi:hypothetical protein